MRPIELVVENFGAYRERATVDFTRLGSLFLVWGPTGSGKTTLFDAMAYALYGEAPGSRKQIPGELRSQYSPAGALPLVEFRFALGAREWRCRRSPPHTRPGRSGKLVEVGQMATLESLQQPEWRVEAEGINAVNERVKALLGLSADEFSKIILLPQGEFQRFLEMASSDRVEILEKLFPVDLHDRVTVLAMEKSKEAKFEGTRLDGEMTRIHGEVEALGGEMERARLEVELARLEAARSTAMEIRVQAEQALVRGREDAERRANHERAQARLAAAEAEAATLPSLRQGLDEARRAAALAPLLDEARRLAADSEGGARELAARRGRLVDIDAEAGPRAEDRALAEGAGTELEAIDRQLGELSKAIEAFEATAALRTAYEGARRSLKEGEARLAAARETEEATLQGLDSARLSADEDERVQGLLTTANEAFERAKAVERGVQLVAEAEAALRAAEAAEAAAAAELEPAEAELAGAEARREAGLAAELAATLVAGQACPVCGSTDHPQPARPLDSGPVAGELERLKRRRESLFGAFHWAEARAVAAGEACTAARTSLLALLGAQPGEGRELPGLESARRAKDLAQAEASKAAQGRLALTEARRRHEGLAKLYEEARRGRELAEQDAAEARTLLAAQEARIQAGAAQAGEGDPRPLARQLDQKRRELGSRREEALARLGNWERERSAATSLLSESEARQPDLEAAAAAGNLRAAESLREALFADEAAARTAFRPAKELVRLEAELRDRESALLSARAAAGEAARARGSGPPPDLAGLETAASEAAAAFASLQADLDTVVANRNQVEALFGRLGQLRAERSELDGRSGRLAALADLLAGNIAPRRLPFKNFVLGAYFRAVVDRASLRLAELSDGRYTLLADEGQVGGRGRLGLELLVRDANTGRTRPSGTLSGGERFLSSLALALGLADTIRSRSGGVSLDAVFIDEGFGSLDEETLDRAISALDRARGDRMIGIVSHVAELRSRIPSRIEVRKGKSGSSLTIVG